MAYPCRDLLPQHLRTCCHLSRKSELASEERRRGRAGVAVVDEGKPRAWASMCARKRWRPIGAASRASGMNPDHEDTRFLSMKSVGAWRSGGARALGAAGA